MLPTFLTFLLAALTASSWAAPAPLTTSATTVTTLSGLQSSSGNDGILIHVLRTEDLIADKIKSKPLLLEKLSHLLIRVELGNQTVAVNGHHLPILPGTYRPLEVNVKLKQVQMLKMPKDSPLVPLGLTAPEILKVADQYMSEGIIAALLTVTQEPLLVQAMRPDTTPVQAEAFKVSIGIKILEVDGLSLAETDIAPVQLVHLIVHPDQADPTKVSTVTTLAPEALRDPQPTPSNLSGQSFPPAALVSAALDSTRASLESTFQALRNAMHGMAVHASGLLNGAFRRKPCHKRPHHHHHHKNPVVKHEAPVELAAATEAPSKSMPDQVVGRQSVVNSFRRKMECFVKMITRSSLAVLLLGLPLALVFLVLAFAFSSLVGARMGASDSQATSTYQAIAVDEKLSDEEIVILMTTTDSDKN